MASSSAAAATSLVVFLLLTGNTIVAIRRSRADDDAAATAFVATSYASLVLLFCCLRQFETSPTGSAAKGRARAGVWITTTLLTAMFSWRVSALMPWPAVSAGVCLMGAATVVGGFYALFLAPTGDD